MFKGQPCPVMKYDFKNYIHTLNYFITLFMFIFIDSSLFLEFDIDIIYVECVLIMNRVRYPNLLCNFPFQLVLFDILFSDTFSEKP